MSKRIKVIIGIALVVTLVLSFSAGCTIATRAITGKDQGSGQGLDAVNQAWNIIFRDYVEKEKLNSANLSAGAIKGMLEALNDPYTSYLTPEMYQASVAYFQGRSDFEGIGAFVGEREGKIIIIAPIPNSPAQKAGVKAGDVVLEIDGKSTEKMGLEEAVLLIRGPKGTTVKLLILHEGETTPVEFEIVRANINVPSVLSDMKGDIAIITITNFSERTDTEFASALEDVIKQGATGIILDLRHNPGGILTVVVDVTSHFLREGVIVQVVDNQGKKTTQSVTPKQLTTDLPVVVLTDNFSASGSEVLAGALQDYGRALIAGKTTYGKGSVNLLYPLNDGSGLYITIARWLTPKGRLIEGQGIVPDRELDLQGDNATNWAIDYLKSAKKTQTPPLPTPALVMSWGSS